MILDQKKYWMQFASLADKDTLCKDLHGSWDKEQQKYTSYCDMPDECVSILKQNTSMTAVLDFGIGMGRNSGYLKSLYKSYKGYDTPPMLENLLKNNLIDKESLIFDFSNIKNLTFDLVYESVVMQHMPPQEVLYVLTALSYHSPYLFSCTRSYNDFLRNFQERKGGVNIALLRKALNCYEPVYSSLPINEIESLTDETEYKILYKSKNFSL